MCKYLNMDCTVYGKFIIQGSAHGKKWCPKPLIPIYPDWDTIPKTGSGQPFSFIDDMSKEPLSTNWNVIVLWFIDYES